MADFIPYGKQKISNDDIENIIEVLKSDWLTQGPKIDLFEKKISNKTNSNFSVSVNSATSALHLSCLSLGVSSNDLVWTSPNTFVASANCALYCGAEIDFVDIDSRTWCMSEVELEKKLQKHKLQKLKMPKVVIPVHLSGQSCNMEVIHKLSKKFGFSIIEDASHAVGSIYKNKPVGNCFFSDITVFSFHPVKIITTGEGGAALTNNKEIYTKLKRLRSHGITKDLNEMVNNRNGEWYYEQIELGFNYRMSDLHAALGISQLNQLDYFVKKRNQVSDIYKKTLNFTKIKEQFVPEDVISSRHLYPIRVSKSERNKLFNLLRNNNFGVNLHYLPVHLHPYYRKIGFKEGDFPEAELYSKEAISLPIYPDLNREDQMRIVDQINKFF